MYPFINIFGFDVQTYSLMALLGFVATMVVAVSLGKHRGIAPDKSFMAIIISGLGIFIGGHFLFILTNIKNIIKAIHENGFSFSNIAPFVSGMVFYGGLFGAIVALLIYITVNKDVGKGTWFDVFAVSVPLFHSFGRVGCFFAGCCYGVESNFGITLYLNASATHYGISRFPVALVEAFFNLLIFVLLLNLYKRNKLKGKLMFVYLLIYSVVRFILEFFRGDIVRGFIFGFSTSQFISILIVCFLIIYFAISIKKKCNKAE